MGPGTKITVEDVSLHNVSNNRLSEKDWRWLERARGPRYNEVDPQRFVQRATEGAASLWRVQSTGLHVLLGLVIKETASGARLVHVELVTGVGYFKNLEKVLVGVKVFAEYYGCEAITGAVMRAGMLKKYKPLGIEPVCEVWSLKV
jgi:hypothetical protein